MKELQDFLKENKMDFDTEAPKEQIEAAKREKRKKKKWSEELNERNLHDFVIPLPAYGMSHVAFLAQGWSPGCLCYVYQSFCA